MFKNLTFKPFLYFLTPLRSFLFTIKGKNNLYTKAIHAGLWSFSLRAIDQVFSLIRLVIIARLLSPSDYGLFGIALLTISVIDTFTQTGIQSALIQKKKNTDTYLDTAWTMSLARGFVLFLIILGTAPFSASFFHSDAAQSIIRVIAVTVLLQGVSNIGMIYFVKNLRFDKLFLYELCGTFAEFAVAITSAFLLRNVWALVYGLLARNIVQCIISYLISPNKPHISFEKEKAKELFTYGKWILGSGILSFLFSQGDDIFVGKFLGITALGLYQMAYRISYLPHTEITSVISTVSFPIYSKLQGNTEQLRKAFLKVLFLVVLVVLPVSGGMFFIAHDFTSLFLGQQWLPMVPAFKILALYNLVLCIGAVAGTLFQGVGKPKMTTQLQFINVVLLAILIYPLTLRWGIAGTALAVLLQVIPVNILAIYLASRLVGSSLRSIATLVGIPFVSTSIMLIVLSLTRIFILPSVSFLSFAFFLLIGIVSFTVSIVTLGKIFHYDIISFLIQKKQM